MISSSSEKESFVISDGNRYAVLGQLKKSESLLKSLRYSLYTVRTINYNEDNHSTKGR
jgi:hypothetical protein